jgi:hypothetical protein
MNPPPTGTGGYSLQDMNPIRQKWQIDVSAEELAQELFKEYVEGIAEAFSTKIVENLNRRVEATNSQIDKENAHESDPGNQVARVENKWIATILNEDPSTISRWRTGKTPLKLLDLMRLLTVLDISPVEAIPRSVPEDREKPGYRRALTHVLVKYFHSGKSDTILADAELELLLAGKFDGHDQSRIDAFRVVQCAILCADRPVVD